MLATGGDLLKASAGRARSPLAGALMLVPGGLLVYFAFNAGGFFLGPQALVALLLALLLAANITFAGRRALARNRPLLTVAACFAAYAGWTLLSTTWSHAPMRATRDFELALLYLLAFVLFGCVSTPRRLRWLLRGLALAAFLVCLVALITRALPSLWPIPVTLDTPRVSYPVTYWNTLGLLAVIGTTLCLGLASDDSEPWPLKAFSALAVPVFAATLLLTFSRGAIGAGVIGVLAFVLLSRGRSVPGALLSTLPPAAFAFHVAYQAGALAHPVADNPAAVGQGHHLATVVVLCALAAAGLRLLLLPLDRRLIAITWRAPIGRRERRLIAGVAGVVAVAVALVSGLPHELHRQYDSFVQGNAFPSYSQARDRLTSTGADGRIDLWRVGVRQFDAQPLHGTGAGTFQLAWERARPRFEPVVNTHSLYLENLGDLGIVGLTLLALVLIASLVALALRLRGPDRVLWAAALAAALAWVVHAGIDWDWQMPVVTLPVIALAGAAFAGAKPASALASRPFVRVALALGVLMLALIPAFVTVSEWHFQRAFGWYEADDCSKASSEAHDALAVLSFRPDAREILGFCEAAAGKRAAALHDLQLAVAEDPDSWETHYGLSIVEAVAKRDPRAEMARAQALNPQDPRLFYAASFFSASLRRYWAQEAALDLLQVDGQGERNIAALRPRR